jgi:16S rRNA G527 N7-methylase RsmG
VDFSLPAVLDSPRFSLALEVVGSVSPVPPSGTLAEFLELLVRWNRRANLVSRASDPADLLADALVDAAALTQVLEAGDGKVADLGAGAGLVSFAIALLAPGLDLVLVESNAHKVDFLRRAAALLSGRGIGGFEVVDARLEELDEGTLWRAAFSRAVWPPAQGWRKAAPHLIPGGLYTALAGPDAAAPRGWNRADYAELFPHPEGYGSRSLLWRYK